MLDMLFTELSKDSKGELDELVKRLLHHPKHHGHAAFSPAYYGKMAWQT